MKANTYCSATPVWSFRLNLDIITLTDAIPFAIPSTTTLSNLWLILEKYIAITDVVGLNLSNILVST